jgi:hypothetical protein
MQTAFHSSFEKLKWEVHSVKEVRPGVVLFDFTFSGKKKTGETISLPGLEYVIVLNGKLQHVEVRNN